MSRAASRLAISAVAEPRAPRRELPFEKRVVERAHDGRDRLADEAGADRSELPASDVRREEEDALAARSGLREVRFARDADALADGSSAGRLETSRKSTKAAPTHSADARPIDSISAGDFSGIAPGPGSRAGCAASTAPRAGRAGRAAGRGPRARGAGAPAERASPRRNSASSARSRAADRCAHDLGQRKPRARTAEARRRETGRTRSRGPRPRGGP